MLQNGGKNETYKNEWNEKKVDIGNADGSFVCRAVRGKHGEYRGGGKGSVVSQ